MVRRALQELKRGDVVNLRIGFPTLVGDSITAEHGIILHTEKGMCLESLCWMLVARWIWHQERGGYHHHDA